MAGILLVGCLVTIGCDRLVPIKVTDILNNPRDYDGKVVTIRGQVTSSLNVLIAKGYSVRDGTGEILVVTTRAVPRPGQTIRVRGRVDQAFAVEGKSLVVLIEGESE